MKHHGSDIERKCYENLDAAMEAWSAGNLQDTYDYLLKDAQLRDYGDGEGPVGVDINKLNALGFSTQCDFYDWKNFVAASTQNSILKRIEDNFEKGRYATTYQLLEDMYLANRLVVSTYSAREDYTPIIFQGTKARSYENVREIAVETIKQLNTQKAAWVNNDFTLF